MAKNNRKQAVHQNGDGKNRKQKSEDEFEKLLSDLNKVTKKVGQEKSKQQKADEKTRRELEEKHTAILEKSKKNDVEQALLLRQQQMQFQKLLQQLMMSQRAFLDKPNTDFKSEAETSNPHFNVAMGEMQGWRSNMEDDHVIDVCFPNGDKESKEGLFCVFDGHSGKGCANFCHTVFPEVLKKHAKKEGDSHTVDFEAAFLEMDGRIKEELKVDESGCTAVAVHVSPTRVTCASVGDSRAVLCRNGSAFDLSQDHKPENDAEKTRIALAGGFVQDNRVNGQLAMSRAMGDFSYKGNKDMGPTEQLVIPLPDVISTERNAATDSFVVLACDGIFDVLSNQELIAFVKARKEEGLDNVKICEAVCHRCLAPTSTDGQPARAEGTDNMTVMIVDLA